MRPALALEGRRTRHPRRRRRWADPPPEGTGIRCPGPSDRSAFHDRAVPRRSRHARGHWKPRNGDTSREGVLQCTSPAISREYSLTRSSARRVEPSASAPRTGAGPGPPEEDRPDARTTCHPPSPVGVPSGPARRRVTRSSIQRARSSTAVANRRPTKRGRRRVDLEPGRSASRDAMRSSHGLPRSPCHRGTPSNRRRRHINFRLQTSVVRIQRGGELSPRRPVRRPLRRSRRLERGESVCGGGPRYESSLGVKGRTLDGTRWYPMGAVKPGT